MKIDQIYISGFEYVVEMAQLARPNAETQIKLEHSTDMLKRVSIGFDISELSYMESFWMHRYAPEFTKKSVVYNDTPVSLEKYPEIGTSLTKIIKVINTIETDSDFNENYIGLSLLPAICIETECHVTYSGASILRLFKVPVETFLARMIGLNLEKAGFTSENLEKITDELIENTLASNFVSGFYQFIADELCSTSAIVRYMTSKLEYNEPSMLVALKSNYGGFNFTNENPNLEELTGVLSDIRDNQDIPTLTFSIHAPLEIMLYLDLMCDDIEVFGEPNLNTMIGNMVAGTIQPESCMLMYEDNDFNKTYHMRVQNAMYGYMRNIISSVATSEKILTSCMMPLNTLVHFSINVSKPVDINEFNGLNKPIINDIAKTISDSFNLLTKL